MRRLQTLASQHYNQLHSQQSMSVSQSPDSVMASDNNLGLSEVNNTAVDTSRAATTSASQKQSSQATTNNKVVNPYLKESPSNNIPTTTVDPILRNKQQFVDKYRIQAIQHSQRNYSSSGARSAEVSSVSALDLLRTNKQWRNHQENQTIQGDDGGNAKLSLSGIIPLRPRLFLFRSYSSRLQQQQQSQIQNTNEGENSMQIEPTISKQHQQNDGIWELDKGITEISGEGGSGKTQICLSLCVTCVMTPLLYPPHPLVSSNSSGECTTGGSIANASLTANEGIARVGLQQNNNNNNIIINEYYTAIYVTMGEGIPTSNIARRLEQMVQARMKDKHDQNRVKDVLSRIGLLSIRNEEDFIEFVERDLPNLLLEQQRNRNNNVRRKKTKIGLVAFDGIAAFFRFNDPLFQCDPMFHRRRGSKLLHASSQLRKLSDVYDVPILITNQVTASIAPTVGNGSNSFDTSSLNSGQNVVPALGLMWSNCVSTRYILQRKDGMVATVDDSVGNDMNGAKNVRQAKKKELRMRKARILQSVNMPEKGREVWFVIDTGEVLAVDP